MDLDCLRGAAGPGSAHDAAHNLHGNAPGDPETRFPGGAQRGSLCTGEMVGAGVGLCGLKGPERRRWPSDHLESGG